MGQRHNRKRTRSRPRNRDTGFRPLHARSDPCPSFDLTTILNTNPNLNFGSTFAPPMKVSSHHQFPFSSPPASHWHQQYLAWHARLQSQEQQQQQQQQRQHENELSEAQRLRLFGGEEGDETSLCAPMLKVVMDLFDGIDYVDP